MAQISPILKCDGHAGYPKYVFVLSLENRSFDHLFGRSGILGTDASQPQDTWVNGVLKAGSTDPNDIDPQHSNTYNGTTYTVPTDDAPFIMPSDPKHEFEHILCQACGPDACKTLFSEFGAGPESMKLDKPTQDFLDNKIPPPPQSQPFWQRYAEATSPGQGDIIRQSVTPSARPAPNNAGFVHSYARSFTVNTNEIGANTPDVAAACPDPGLVMRCFNTKSQLPILYQLAKNYLICDNFFSSLPGPTGPNRFFMMAGSSAGYDGGPSSTETATWTGGGHLPANNGNIFTKLGKAGVPFRIYGDDNFPMAGVMEGVHTTNTFDVHDGKTHIRPLEVVLKEATNDKPFPYNFVWIEPDYDVASSIKRHAMYSTGNSMHPCSDVRKAEQLIADVYNWISGNPSVWNNCVLFITWDEHGGFFDHVVPPTATPPGDSPSEGRTWKFKFDRFGTRVPCLIISPFIQSNLIDHRQYDHTSILKTVIDLHNKGAFTKDGSEPSKKMSAWTNRIGSASSFISLFTAPNASKTVALNTPLEPADMPAAAPAAPADGKPTGNTPLFLASAMNLHKTADPSANPGPIKTNAEAATYFETAAKAVDDAQAQGTA